MAKKNNNNKPRKNFFTINNKPIETLTANDIEFSSDRIFKDLARGNFDPNLDGPKFNNPQLLTSLINAAQTRFVEANLIANSMHFCFEDVSRRGLQVDQQAANIKNKWQSLANGYNIIISELTSLKYDGDYITHIVRMSQQLSSVKQCFR